MLIALCLRYFSLILRKSIKLYHFFSGTRQNASYAPQSQSKDGGRSRERTVERGGGGGGGGERGSERGGGGSGDDHAYAAPPVAHSPAYANPPSDVVEVQTTWAQNAGENI